MAITDVCVSDMISNDDHLTPYYPRAPPPSPEMQPKSRGLDFEIPASKFSGIGLDLRRDSFPLEEEDEFPIPTSHHHHQYPLTGSPQKRVCCSPNVVSRDHMITSFPSSSNKDSLVSSGFVSCSTSLRDPILEESGMGNGIGYRESMSHSHSKSAPYFDSQTTPHLMSHREGTHTPNGVLNSATSLYVPNSSNHALSHSYDLHSIHAHLPHSFEATRLLPEPRPTRSRTLDSAALTLDVARARSKTLDASYGEDPTERKRKVSIKRRNPEENEGDPSLQFCFDYSYSSSTGSNGGGGGGVDSDWVVVDHNVESTWPLEKKACCSSDPLSVALSSQKPNLNTSPLFVTSPFATPGGLQMVGGSGSGTTFPAPTLFPPSRQDGGESANTPTNQHFVFHSDDSSMMDLGGGKLDYVDSMDCDQTQVIQVNSTDNVIDSTPGFGRGSNSIFTGSPWGATPKLEIDNSMTFTNTVQLSVEHQYTQDGGGGSMGVDPVMRVHRPIPPTSQVLSRHSCMEEYLKIQPNPHHQGEVGDGDLELERVGLSKSL